MVAVVRLSGEELAAWVARSCELSGVPVFVADPAALGRVGRLVGGGPGAPARRASAEEAPGRRSQLPVNLDAGRVDAAGSHGSGGDGDVVDEGFDDGDLLA
ncbi:hypothetical protein GCM10009721_33990 [Terrabacter tumescens]|uniref:Uncharacterized protein n=1 Tax=Terrabacter tumescens TaxID=60443 RepID=A0ABQ2IB99_9MICO|nr:hypothetical protein GCM10009721_33990 [Terrabacter tumescens]